MAAQFTTDRGDRPAQGSWQTPAAGREELTRAALACLDLCALSLERLLDRIEAPGREAPSPAPGGSAPASVFGPVSSHPPGRHAAPVDTRPSPSDPSDRGARAGTAPPGAPVIAFPRPPFRRPPKDRGTA